MIEYELVRHDRLKGIRLFVNTIRIRSAHMHHDLELLYVLKGNGDVLIRNQSFSLCAGNMILINAYESHEIISSQQDFTLIVIQFSPHFLQDYCPLRYLIFPAGNVRNMASEEEYGEMQQLVIASAASYLSGDMYSGLGTLSALSRLLHLIMKCTRPQEISEAEYSRKRKNEHRLKQISDYIELNYQNQIRLGDLAEKEGITVTHLSHLIREHFGISFQEYVRNKRLEHAVRMIHGSYTLSEISDFCGFSELKYMTRAFQNAFHMTPQEYRNITGGGQKYVPEGSTEYIWPDRDALKLLEGMCREKDVL